MNWLKQIEQSPDGMLWSNHDKSNIQNTNNQNQTNSNNADNSFNQTASNNFNNATTFDTNLANQNLANIGKIGQGPTQSQLSDLWYGGGASGGIDPNQINNAFNPSTPGFQNLAQTGGMTPEFTTAYNQSLTGLDAAAKGFGNLASNPVAPTDQSGIMGQINSSGSYDPNATSEYANFAQNGGYSPSD